VGDILVETVSRLEFHTSQTVKNELANMAKRDDDFADAAELATHEIESGNLSIHTIEFAPDDFHNRIDTGEASCIVLGNRMEAQYLLTDDHRARHRIEQVFNGKIIHSPYIVGAFYRKEIVDQKEALIRFLRMSEKGNWMDSPLMSYGADIIFEDIEIPISEVAKIIASISTEKFGEKLEALSESILKHVGLYE